jgi:hypothetical protein
MQIKNLPNSKDSRFEVESFFNKFGKVRHVDATTSEDVVYVRFNEPEVAKDALNSILFVYESQLTIRYHE